MKSNAILTLIILTVLLSVTSFAIPSDSCQSTVSVGENSPTTVEGQLCISVNIVNTEKTYRIESVEKQWIQVTELETLTPIVLVPLQPYIVAWKDEQHLALFLDSESALMFYKTTQPLTATHFDAKNAPLPFWTTTKISILLLALSIFSSVLFFLSRKIKPSVQIDVEGAPVQEKEITHHVHHKQPTHEEIVKKYLTSGYKVPQLRDMLAKKGWTKHQIDATFKKILGQK